MAIVALWAAVLIPMWLRRHDDDQARRIERHRVAMGTLARMGESTEATHRAASRRRRVILAACAIVAVLVTAAWIAGFVPGVLVALGWMPLVAYVPAAFIAERRAIQRAAEMAVAERRVRRARRAIDRDASAVIETPATSRTTLDTAPAHDTVAWDEVFDQSA